MMASIIAIIDFAPGREGVDARDRFAIGRTGPKGRVGVFSPRRVGRVGASLTLAGTLRAMTLACSFPVLSRQVEGLDGLPQCGTRLIASETSGHVATMRRAHAACHGAGKAGGAP
ncbi:hypothetical protein D3C87_1239280 [compost metagenome]